MAHRACAPQRELLLLQKTNVVRTKRCAFDQQYYVVRYALQLPFSELPFTFCATAGGVVVHPFCKKNDTLIATLTGVLTINNEKFVINQESGEIEEYTDQTPPIFSNPYQQIITTGSSFLETNLTEGYYYFKISDSSSDIYSNVFRVENFEATTPEVLLADDNEALAASDTELVLVSN